MLIDTIQTPCSALTDSFLYTLILFLLIPCLDQKHFNLLIKFGLVLGNRIWQSQASFFILNNFSMDLINQEICSGSELENESLSKLWPFFLDLRPSQKNAPITSIKSISLYLIYKVCASCKLALEMV